MEAIFRVLFCRSSAVDRKVVGKRYTSGTLPLEDVVNREIVASQLLLAALKEEQNKSFADVTAAIYDQTIISNRLARAYQ